MHIGAYQQRGLCVNHSERFHKRKSTSDHINIPTQFHCNISLFHSLAYTDSMSSQHNEEIAKSYNVATKNHEGEKLWEAQEAIELRDHLKNAANYQ